jgi:hypothetical protein
VVVLGRRDPVLLKAHTEVIDRRVEAESAATMAMEIPLPPSGDDRILAVPLTESLVIFRLTHSQQPNSGDFNVLGPGKAEEREVPEIHRLGLSFYITAEAAALRSNHPRAWVSRIELAASPRIHVARDRAEPEHVEVWAPRSLDWLSVAEPSVWLPSRRP